MQSWLGALHSLPLTKAKRCASAGFQAVPSPQKSPVACTRLFCKTGCQLSGASSFLATPKAARQSRMRPVEMGSSYVDDQKVRNIHSLQSGDYVCGHKTTCKSHHMAMAMAPYGNPMKNSWPLVKATLWQRHPMATHLMT